MIAFLAEQGGFMEYKTPGAVRGDLSTQGIVSRRASQHESHYSSVSEEFLKENGHGDSSVSIPRPMDVTSQAAMNAAAGHDDSGIGMRTPDDDFSMGKYEFGGDSHVQISSTDLDHAMPQASAA